MRYGRLSYTDLAKVWRFILPIIVFELLGGSIGLAIAYHHSSFMNFWAGGALGILPGVIVGAIWHFRHAPDRKESVHIVVFIGLIAGGVFVMAAGFEIPRLRYEMQMLERLSNFPYASIRRIDVFGRYGSKHIKTLTHPEAVAAFGRSIVDARGHSPNHPNYTQSWRVVAMGSTRHEFDLHLDPEFPDSVIGYFVETSGKSTRYYGKFKSKSLRPWVDRHLMGGNVTD